jgi:outer membrane protein assembly factor BamB
VYALNAANGKVFWQAKGIGSISSPLVVGGGSVCFVKDNSVYALNAANGNPAWNRQNNGGVLAPTIAGDVAYIGGDFNGTLYALNAATGSQLWSTSGLGALSLAPTVANGLVYADSWGDKVIALDTNGGGVQWTNPGTGLGTSFSPVVAYGVVYTGGGDAKSLIALDAKGGGQLWKYPLYGNITAPPTVADGTALVACDTHFVYAISIASGKNSWTSASTIGNVKSSPAIWQGE